MALEGEAKILIERLRENCDVLARGYNESVEYKVAVLYHGDGCARVAVVDCDCPKVNESRKKKVWRPSLLKQLREYQQYKDVDRNPKAARGAPRVKTPKMHPELAGFFTLDEIASNAYMAIDRALEEAGRDRAWACGWGSIDETIRQLPTQAEFWVIDFPEVVRTMIGSVEGWVRQARRSLKIDVADAMFAGVVCGNCGGGLAVPWDNGGDVRCVGSPVEPPCGETYPMSEWITLYEKGRTS